MTGIDRTSSHFCRRSNLRELHSRSRRVLEAAVAAGSKLEVISFNFMDLDNAVYDIIVPGAKEDPGSSLEHPQSCLPQLHSLYVFSGRLWHCEGLRRVSSACPIYEIGIDKFCSADGTHLSGIGEFQDWVGPGLKASFVLEEKELGYTPFDI